MPNGDFILYILQLFVKSYFYDISQGNHTNTMRIIIDYPHPMYLIQNHIVDSNAQCVIWRNFNGNSDSASVFFMQILAHCHFSDLVQRRYSFVTYDVLSSLQISYGQCLYNDSYTIIVMLLQINNW
jgi:hypothetical protein